MQEQQTNIDFNVCVYKLYMKSLEIIIKLMLKVMKIHLKGK